MFYIFLYKSQTTYRKEQPDPNSWDPVPVKQLPLANTSTPRGFWPSTLSASPAGRLCGAWFWSLGICQDLLVSFRFHSWRHSSMMFHDMQMEQSTKIHKDDSVLSAWPNGSNMLTGCYGSKRKPQRRRPFFFFSSYQ